MGAWSDAVALEELPDGSPHAVRVGTTRVLFVRQGEEVHAFEAVCPHKFADLAEGHIEDGCLHCPMHDAAFGMDGRPRAGDEWAGFLPTFPCQVAAGRVQVRI